MNGFIMNFWNDDTKFVTCIELKMWFQNIYHNGFKKN